MENYEEIVKAKDKLINTLMTENTNLKMVEWLRKYMADNKVTKKSLSFRLGYAEVSMINNIMGYRRPINGHFIKRVQNLKDGIKNEHEKGRWDK